MIITSRASADPFFPKGNRVLGMVESDSSLDADDKACRVAALKGAKGRLALITPELCENYLRAWADDRQRWQRHLQRLPAWRNQQSPESVRRVAALKSLSNPGAPQLRWELGAQGERLEAPTSVDTQQRQPQPSPARVRELLASTAAGRLRPCPNAGAFIAEGPVRRLPREVPILTAVSFTVALGYGIVAPAIPAFARQFGVSTVAAASVISAFALMRLVGRCGRAASSITLAEK